MIRRASSLLWCATALAWATLPAAPALAATTISQGYISTKPLDDGALVSTNNNPGIIMAATTDNADTMVGVVASGQNALISVSTTANEVQVASAGITGALVSTANGNIKVGDRITASPLEGVGQKVTTSTRVVGVAQASLDAKTRGATKTTIKDKSGAKKDIYVAKIPLLINLTYYTVGEGTKQLVPSFLQHIANAVAGKQVSSLPIAVGVIILVITVLVSGVISFTATRSSIISIGRNPLSRNSVIGSLIQSMFLVVGILGVGLAAIFLVLRLV